MNREEIQKELDLFRPQMDEITRARSPYELRYFVIGRHESRWKQWYQLVIECEEKFRALQEAEASQRLTLLEIEELELKKPVCSPHLPDREKRLVQILIEKTDIEIQKKRNSLDRLKSLMVGALKEIQDFLTIARTEFSDFYGKKEDDLLKEHELPYWKDRLSRQVAMDLLTHQQITQGNLNVLLQMPREDQKEILKKAIDKRADHLRLADETQAELEALADQTKKAQLEKKELHS